MRKMSVIYCNPENALKRADEFLELGKHVEAVDCLCDVLRNRRSRILKSIHEAIINKLLEICVDNKMSASAKDGLYLYRYICQGTNVMSWEDALKRLLLLAEQKIQQAKQESPTSAPDCDTLDQTTPKSLLDCVSKEGNGNNEKEYAFTLCWIKFMVECYRLCLELLRTSQTDKLYHHIAQNAFMFCLKYSLRTELLKLCNLFRMHFGYFFKKQAQTPPPITNAETLTLYLETGLIELECTFQMELWQDAFKTTEDINFVIGMLRKPVNCKIVASFYEKLAAIFWKSNDLLYHAAALFRHFILCREQKNLTENDISRMSSSIVLAVLSVPFESHNPAADLITENDVSVIDKRHRMLSILLNFPTKPTRNSLLKKLEQHCIVQSALPEIQNMHRLLEHEVDPLKLNAKLISLQSVLTEKVQWDLEQYFAPLNKIVIIRLLSQFSRIYKTLTLKKFISAIPVMKSFDLELLIVDSARKYNIPIRMDHVNECLHFNSDASLFENQSSVDGPENKVLRAERTGNYLSLLLSSQKKMATYLQPEAFKWNAITMRESLRVRYLSAQRTNRREMLERRKLIDNHKAMLEKMRLKKEEYERKLIVDKQLKYEAAEKERLVKEAEKRAAQRRILQEKEIKKQIFLEKVESLKKTEFGQIIEKLELSELESLDPEILWCKHIEHINKEKKEFQSRLQRQERSVDHLERAKRKEEIPLLMLQYDENKVSSRELWERDEKLKIQAAYEERSRVIHIRDRFLNMKDDLIQFVRKVNENKRQEYIEKCTEFRQVLETERQRRLDERALKRKKQRRQAWVEEQEKRAQQKKRATLIENTEPRGKYINASSVKEYNQPLHHRIQTRKRDTEFLNRPKNNEKRVTEYETTQRYIPPETSTLIHRSSDRRNTDQSPTKRKFLDDTESSLPKYQILKREERYGTIGDNPSAESGSLQRNTEIGAWKQTERHTKRMEDNYSKQPEPSTSKTKPRFQMDKQFSETQPRSVKDSNFICGEPSQNLWRKKDSTQVNLGSSTEYSRSKDERIQSNAEETQKFDTRRSCTPWAKLKRKDDTK